MDSASQVDRVLTYGKKSSPAPQIVWIGLFPTMECYLGQTYLISTLSRVAKVGLLYVLLEHLYRDCTVLSQSLSHTELAWVIIGQ